MIHGTRGRPSRGPRSFGRREAPASPSSVPRPSDPTSVPSVNTADAATTSPNSGPVELMTFSKLERPTSRGKVPIVMSRPSVTEKSNAPAYGSSTSTQSKISAGVSRSQGAAQPGILGRETRRRPAVRSAVSPLFSLDQLVHLSGGVVEGILHRHRSLDGLLDRGVDVLDDLVVRGYPRRELRNTRRLHRDRVVRIGLERLGLGKPGLAHRDAHELDLERRDVRRGGPPGPVLPDDVPVRALGGHHAEPAARRPSPPSALA